MDDPELDAAQHQRALRGLQRIHRLTGTAQRLWKNIRAAMRARGETEWTILDVGCGDGALLRELHHLASKSELRLRLMGCDFSSRAVDLARAAAERERISIQWYLCDVLQQELPVQADAVICSLFLHHFQNADIVNILSTFRQHTHRLLLVEDLLRTRLGYGLCWIGVHALSRSRVVHVDGLLSVRAALTVDEIEALCQQAGLGAAQIEKHWPERFLVHWSPTDSTLHGDHN